MIIPDSWNDFFTHHPLICGVMNLTPDSFSDGGELETQNQIVERADSLIRNGADFLDIGAESTRPGAHEVPVAQQRDRLEKIFRSDISSRLSLSIDTRHAEIAHDAIEHGFIIINDVSGATFDQDMARTMSDTNALCVVMHMRGTPETMMSHAHYDDVTREVCDELKERVDYLVRAGVAARRIMVDPGIGFAKEPSHNLQLLNDIELIKGNLGLPLMVGVSRKSVVSYMLTGSKTAASRDDRDSASAELARDLAHRGVDVLRVHNVKLTNDAIR